jgi:hypothetical protein
LERKEERHASVHGNDGRCGVRRDLVRLDERGGAAADPAGGDHDWRNDDLAFEPNASGYSCTVMDVRGDFVGCKADTSIPGRTTHEHWYNLRLVTRIDRPARQ